MEKKRVRETWRLTFNILGLSYSKGIKFACVVLQDKSKANGCKWREKGLKPKWRRTFQYYFNNNSTIAAITGRTTSTIM